jgi:hypothetical protein
LLLEAISANWTTIVSVSDALDPRGSRQEETAENIARQEEPWRKAPFGWRRRLVQGWLTMRFRKRLRTGREWLVSVLSGPAALRNAAEPLTIPTYAPGDQLVHPSVVLFPGSWNGYRYWMAMTPFPGGDDRYENPSIVVSQDGQCWEEPPGIRNPLYPKPFAYNADPCLFFHEAENALWLYFLSATSEKTGDLLLMRSRDGVHWTPAEIVIADHVRDTALSPSILKVGDVYYLFSVDIVSPGSRPFWLTMRTSSDGKNWSDPNRAVLPSSRYSLWHVEVKYIDGKFFAMTGSSWIGANSKSGAYAQFLESYDGIHWKEYRRMAIGRAWGKWDDRTYKASFLLNGDDIEVWYSSALTWRIGHTKRNFRDFLAALGGTRG